MVSKEEARRYIQDCSTEQCFWVNNGPILKSLDELVIALPGLSSETFAYHVNNDKNDFSNWIRDTIGDQKLANEILSSKNKESIVKKIRTRLVALKKKAS